MPMTVNAIRIVEWFSGVSLPEALPISDPEPDPGLMGPGSLTWKMHREQWLILGGAQAFLLQAAHPVVAQGALDHSAYAEDPFGRVYRTVIGMSVLITGSTREVNAMAQRINRLHQSVTGTVNETIGSHHTSDRYSAMDLDPLLWVHVAFVESMLTAYRCFVGPLSDVACEQYWQESCRYARLLGLTDVVLPSSYQAMKTYLQQATANGNVIVGSGARTIAQTILYPPVPWHRKPIWALVRLLAAGQLPPPIRQGYGLRWSWRDRLGFRIVSSTCRLSRFLFPHILGRSQLVEFAEQRARGGIEHASANSLPLVTPGTEPGRYPTRKRAKAKHGTWDR